MKLEIRCTRDIKVDRSTKPKLIKVSVKYIHDVYIENF